MMISTKAVSLALLASIPIAANAQSKPDFGSLAICASLGKMPTRYKAIECNQRNPLRQCSFTLSADKLPIKYLVDDGIVVSKWIEFGNHAAFVGPFGLKRGDSDNIAVAKVRRATGLAFERWADDQDAEGTYYQSTDINCRKNIYNLRIFFHKGKLETLSVSSLPMV